MLFSSHQLDLVDRLCDSLVVLAGGQVRAAGTGDELRARGPRRHRITTEGDAGWLRGRPGVEVLDVAGPTAVVQFTDDAARDQTVRVAAERGLSEFTPIVPTLSEIFREAVQ